MTTPTVGQPLPRAAEAYSASEKWREWIFADRGHGREWARVFHVELDAADAERAWQAIIAAALHAPIATLVDRQEIGLICGVEVELTINSRTASVRTSWHYKHPVAAPRLVTAYPRL
jgi:hypothetical protein